MTFSSSRYSMPCSPPFSIDLGLSLSCAFRLFRVPSCFHLPPPLSTIAFLGVSFSFAATVQGALANELPAPIYVSPSAFLALSTNYSSPHLWTCFIPLPRPRFHFRGFPQHPAGQTFDLPYLPVVNVACDVSPSRSSPMCRSVAIALKVYPLQLPDPLLCFSSLGFFSVHLDESPLLTFLVDPSL
jgi:hypothetical protein